MAIKLNANAVSSDESRTILLLSELATVLEPVRVDLALFSGVILSEISHNSTQLLIEEFRRFIALVDGFNSKYGLDDSTKINIVVKPTTIMLEICIGADTHVIMARPMFSKDDMTIEKQIVSEDIDFSLAMSDEYFYRLISGMRLLEYGVCGVYDEDNILLPLEALSFLAPPVIEMLRQRIVKNFSKSDK